MIHLLGLAAILILGVAIGVGLVALAVAREPELHRNWLDEVIAAKREGRR